MSQVYQPEAGYGPFDKFAKLNRQIVANVARQIEMSPDLLMAVAASESGFSSKARSDKGAVGIMQVMPATAREVANELGQDDLHLDDPVQNALLGGLYLKKMFARYGGDVHLALAAYHAGPGSVDLWIGRSSGRERGIDIVKRYGFRQTRGYIQDVLRRAGAGATVPFTQPEGSSATNGLFGRYACVVGDDDTLCSLARRNGIVVRDLWRLNLQKMNAVGDGKFLASGQVVWLRALPAGLEREQNTMGGLSAAAVEIRVNRPGNWLQFAVAGTVIRRYELGLDSSTDGGKTHARDGISQEGSYPVCRKIALSPYGQCLQLSYPNENDAWNALLQGRIGEDEYDRIIGCLAVGEPPPSDTELGGEVYVRGKGNNSDYSLDANIVLCDADADELFALTPNGARVIIEAEDDLLP